jgi:type IV secretory pathway VirB10-like protein
MGNTRNILLSAALCGSALLTFACGRPSEETKTAAATPPPAMQDQASELRPEQRTVEVDELTDESTPAPPETSQDQDQADLAARERELAQRQADLDAREQELRARERAKPKAIPRPRAEEPASVPVTEPDETRTADRDADVSDIDVRPEPPAVTAQDEPAEPDEPEEPAAPEPEEVRLEPVRVPAGTVLEVEMLDTISSENSHPGDTFRARVSGSVRSDGRVAIPSGSEVMGEVTEAVPLRKIGGQARLAVRFTDLVLPDGSTVPIDASFVQSGRNETGKDAATIGGGAAAGAVLGRVLGKGNRSKGSVIGAIIGAAAGAVIASRTPGEEVVIPEGTVVSLRLDEAVNVQVDSR